MSATTVPPPTSPEEAAEPDPSMLELDLRLRHPQQPPVPGGYTAAGASSTATKSRPRRPAKPPPPKKQPQRGLGVAQLERLRLQERWKKLVEIPGPQLQQLPVTGPGPVTAPMPVDPQVVPHFQYLQPGVAGGGTPHPPPPPPPFQYHVMDSAGVVQPHRETGGRCLPPGVFGMGRGYVVGNPHLDGWDGVNSGASRELSSMPNARALVPDHADHNIYLTAGMNGKVKPVVGGVVLEYEFFPGKRCRNTWNEEQCMPSVGVEGRGAASDSAPASSVAAAAEASNSIDLSLKL